MITLVTGAAGFIGSYVCQQLLASKQQVIGVDNLNDAYDVKLKQDRLAQITSAEFSFVKLDVADTTAMSRLFVNHQIDQVVHLAAEAGQATDQAHMKRLVDSNLVGFNVVLDNCRQFSVKHLVYASTAAVYGDNADFPVTENSQTDQPLSLYAASKKANEVLAHSYASMYGLPSTGLRFFTVYGPWGRPDMALYKFTRRILQGLPLDIHNMGNHTRDLIYIDDLVTALLLALQAPPQSQVPHQTYNLGTEKAIGLMTMVEQLEDQLGQRTKHRLLPRQTGVIRDNQADATLFNRQFGFTPKVGFNQGLKKFVDWYRAYHLN